MYQQGGFEGNKVLLYACVGGDMWDLLSGREGQGMSVAAYDRDLEELSFGNSYTSSGR